MSSTADTEGTATVWALPRRGLTELEAGRSLRPAAREVASCPAREPWPRVAAARRLGPASASAQELGERAPAASLAESLTLRSAGPTACGSQRRAPRRRGRRPLRPRSRFQAQGARLPQREHRATPNEHPCASAMAGDRAAQNCSTGGARAVRRPAGAPVAVAVRRFAPTAPRYLSALLRAASRA